MGTIDAAVPFFGDEFNRIYPLIMVIYTLLVASNFFDRVIGFFGSWKRFRFQTEADDMDGFDPSGLIILQKGRHTMTCFQYAFSTFFHLLWTRLNFMHKCKTIWICVCIPGKLTFFFPQNALGLNKGAKSVNMSFHWQGISTVLMLSPAAITQYALSLSLCFYVLLSC